jgi:hypothetical protein
MAFAAVFLPAGQPEAKDKPRYISECEAFPSKCGVLLHKEVKMLDGIQMENVTLAPGVILKRISCETLKFEFTVVNRRKTKIGTHFGMKFFDKDNDPIPNKKAHLLKLLVMEPETARDIRHYPSRSCEEIAKVRFIHYLRTP